MIIYGNEIRMGSQKEFIQSKKNEVNFYEVKEIFDDPLRISFLDERFSYFEERWISVVQTTKRKLVVTAHLYFDENEEEVIRIISAREATINEREQYEKI